MALKFVVSFIVYYVYIFLKTKVVIYNVKTKSKINFEFLWGILFLLFLISNDLLKFAFFILISSILSLIFLYQYKNKKIKEKKEAKWQIIILMILYLLPIIPCVCFFDLKWISYFYLLFGVLSILHPWIIKYSLKLFTKIKFVYNKKEK